MPRAKPSDDDKAAPPDWERIEASFRAGTMSLREIAAAHGISEGAIRKRAKRDDWSRDLNAKVRAKADELVRKELVRSEVRVPTATEKQTVEVEAQVQARIRISHRTDIARFRALALSLLTELEAETGNAEEFEQLGDMLRNEDERGQDKRNDIYRRVISSAGRIDSTKKLAETLKVLIALEREAYGMTAEPVDDPGDKLSRAVSDFVNGLHSRQIGRLPITAPVKGPGK
jgi:hypothetical protein